MRLSDLYPVDLRRLSQEFPHWLTNARPDLMAAIAPEWLADNYPEILAAHRPNWLANYRPETLAQYRPDVELPAFVQAGVKLCPRIRSTVNCPVQSGGAASRIQCAG